MEAEMTAWLGVPHKLVVVLQSQQKGPVMQCLFFCSELDISCRLRSLTIPRVAGLNELETNVVWLEILPRVSPEEGWNFRKHGECQPWRSSNRSGQFAYRQLL